MFPGSLVRMRWPLRRSELVVGRKGCRRHLRDKAGEEKKYLVHICARIWCEHAQSLSVRVRHEILLLKLYGWYERWPYHLGYWNKSRL